MSVARYQMYNPRPVWLDLAGVENIPGGSLTFYAIGTTNPQNTYSARSGGSINSNPVVLDSSGRANTNVWLLGEYSIVVKDVDGATVGTFDMDSGNDAAQAIPIPDPGEYVTGDGSQFLVEDLNLRLLPDATGLVGWSLVSDGEGWIPQAPTETPEPAEDQIVVGTNSLRAGVSDDATKGLFQCGTGSASASGTFQTSAAVVYATPYATAPVPVVTPTGGPFATGNGAGGYYVDFSITSQSNSGFTVTFNANHGEENSDGNITSAVTFNWLAYGTVEVA